MNELEVASEGEGSVQDDEVPGFEHCHCDGFAGDGVAYVMTWRPTYWLVIIQIGIT